MLMTEGSAKGFFYLRILLIVIHMKFIIDENITPDVLPLFLSAGLTAIHVNQLKKEKGVSIKDHQLRRLAIHQDWIIVTKDDDFVKSFVSRKVPEKLVFIVGLDEKKKLMERMKAITPNLKFLLMKHDFLEINELELKMPFG